MEPPDEEGPTECLVMLGARNMDIVGDDCVESGCCGRWVHMVDEIWKSSNQD